MKSGDCRLTVKKIFSTSCLLLLVASVPSNSLADTVLDPVFEATKSLDQNPTAESPDYTRSTYGSSIAPTPTVTASAESTYYELPTATANSLLRYNFMVAGPDTKPIDITVNSLLSTDVNVNIGDSFFLHRGTSTSYVSIFGGSTYIGHSIEMDLANRDTLLNDADNNYYNFFISYDGVGSYLNNADGTESALQNYVDTFEILTNTLYSIEISAQVRAKSALANALADPYIQINNPEAEYQLQLSPGIGNQPLTAAPVPEPSTLLLFGTGALAFSALNRRRSAI